MLDIEKLRVECLKTIHSWTAEEIQEWLDMDTKRMAELEKKNNHLNGSAVNGIAVNGNARRKATQPRSVNGRFISKQEVACY